MVDFPVDHAIGSQLFALLAEKILLFLSNRLVKNLFIAESVLYPNHVTTGKSLIVETFPGSSLSIPKNSEPALYAGSLVVYM